MLQTDKIFFYYFFFRKAGKDKTYKNTSISCFLYLRVTICCLTVCYLFSIKDVSFLRLFCTENTLVHDMTLVINLNKQILTEKVKSKDL